MVRPFRLFMETDEFGNIFEDYPGELDDIREVPDQE